MPSLSGRDRLENQGLGALVCLFAVFESPDVSYNAAVIALNLQPDSLMAEQPVVIQRISWADVFPWTILFRALPIATSFTVIVLGTMGVLLSFWGWWLSDALILDDATRQMPAVRAWQTPGMELALETVPAPRSAAAMAGWSSWLSGGPATVFQRLVEPFRQVFGFPANVRTWWYFLLGGLWNIAVWSLLGVAIARVSLLQMTRHEHIGIREALSYAVGKWTACLGAVTAPLIAVAVLTLPALLAGLFLGLDLGVLVIGLGWFLVVMIATAMGLLLLGLMFGWPLIVSSVACEGQNAFDAMTRAFAYTFQRPLRYLAYALLALFIGGLAWWLAAALAQGIVGLTYWSTSWGANLTGLNRIEVVMGGAVFQDGAMVEPTASLQTGRTLIGWWNGLVGAVASGFLYGLSWCLASAIYLLLRFDIDETEMDEIFISEDQRSYQLPPLKSDENGIPQVQTPASSGIEDAADDSATDGETPPETPAN